MNDRINIEYLNLIKLIGGTVEVDFEEIGLVSTQNVTSLQIVNYIKIYTPKELIIRIKMEDYEEGSI